MVQRCKTLRVCSVQRGSMLDECERAVRITQHARDHERSDVGASAAGALAICMSTALEKQLHTCSLLLDDCGRQRGEVLFVVVPDSGIRTPSFFEQFTQLADVALGRCAMHRATPVRSACRHGPQLVGAPGAKATRAAA